MTEAKRGQSVSTFVVRFWRVSSASDEAEGSRWYGQAEHVQSGERRAFRNLEQMARFMQDYVGMEFWSGPQHSISVAASSATRKGDG